MVTLLIAALATQGLALPVRAVGDGVVVRAEAGMGELARDVADAAPAALALIYADLEGLPRPPAIEIRLVKEAGSLQGAAPPGARVPEWAVGVAFPSTGVVAVCTRRGSHSVNVGSVVTHELAHMALGAALDDRAPRWLDEGFAYLHSSDWSWARTQTLTGMAWSGNRYFLFELEDRFPPGENAAAKAYAQAFDFVAFLAKRGRFVDTKDDGNREPFRHFLAELAAGRGTDHAALEAFGVGMDQLENEWWQGMRQRYVWSMVGLFTLAVWVFGALLLILGWLRKRRQGKRRLAEWAAAEEEAQDGAYAAAETENRDTTSSSSI
jgi:hypothetical protein